MRPEGENLESKEAPNQPQSATETPQNGFSGRTIQPISSEGEIRASVESASNIISPPNPEVQPTPPTSPAITTPPVSAGTGQGNTPPASTNQSSSPSAPGLPPVLENDPQPRKKKGLIITLILLVLAGLGVGAYFLIPRPVDNQPALDSLTDAALNNAAEIDLTSETINNTTYLRPQQWLSTRIGLTDWYGSSAQSQGRPVAMVNVSQAQLASSNTQVDSAQLRKFQAVSDISKLTETHAKPIFSTCSSEVDSKVEEDVQELNNSIGLTLITSTCSREDGQYIVKTRTVTNDDKRVRTITLAATSSEWDKNKNAFQKILESVTASPQ